MLLESLNITLTPAFIKGALDNFSLNPQFFLKEVLRFIPLEVYT